MRPLVKLWLLESIAICFVPPLLAQSLAPRAYVLTPVHANAVTLTWSFYQGGVNFNGTIPITSATGTYSVPTLSLYHSLSFFGRSANITASLPYGVGTFSGDVFGKQQSVYRLGLLDLAVRFSVNLRGGPTMKPQQFLKWKQKILLGTSLTVIAPTGQYNGAKLVNWGINRWAIRPEFGYSERWGKWVLDSYVGAWFYTSNPASYDIPVPKPQSETPIGSFEGHLSYDFSKQRLWVSLDANFWFGGIATLNGIQNHNTRQTSSRIGGTVSVPLSRRQSLKIAYSEGAYVRYGGNYHNLQVAWQYSWVGHPN